MPFETLQEQTDMSKVEQMLKEFMAERSDVAGKILSSDELLAYIGWVIERYTRKFGANVLNEMPAFTNRTGMAAFVAEISAHPDKRKAIARLSKALAVQSDEDFLTPGQTISVGRMPRYYPAQWHMSTYFQVCYAPAGVCPVHFQNETIELKNGALLIIAPNVMHATPCYADDAILKLYMLRASTFQHVFWNQLGDDNLLTKFFRIALDNHSITSYLHFETDSDPEVQRILLQIDQEYQTEKPYGQQMINSLMRLFFLLILRRYEGTARLPRTDYFFWKHQFSGILSYIQTHYQHATLNSVAEKFNYSSKQVGRIVKDCTGEPFGDLIRSMKMKKAVELLLDRKYPPEQVAPLVGFATVNSFYRSFKDYYGLPPLEWVSKQQSG